MDPFKLEEQQDKNFFELSLSPVLHQVIAQVLKDRPRDVVSYIINFLKHQYNIKSIGDLTPHQRQELNDLRFEVKRLRQERGETFEVGSEAETESDDDEDDVVDDLPSVASTSKKGPRTSVSAEAFGMWNKKGDFKPPSYPKSAEQKQKIKKRLGEAFMFSMLDEKEKDILVDAMQVVNFQAKDTIIKEGDDGDNLFVVEEGKLSCTKVLKKGDPPTHLKDYAPGEAFGELALLYNAPRAATIVASTPCTLLSLDRQTFNHIVKDAAMKKRERYQDFLKNVKILTGMDAYERSKLADAMKVETYKKGDYIIKQGESGNVFYFIEEGSAIATKSIDGAPPKQVMEYEPGSYFGELALLSSEPRAANIIAQSDVSVLSLDRHSFKRLLGPLEDILKRNMDIYKEYTGK